LANAKARFESIHYYMKTSYTVEVCAYKVDTQNAAVVAAQPVLFMLDEKRVTERVRSPCVGHILGFWVPVEIRGRSLVRWKALAKSYMPTFFFWILFVEENVV
jgi:hypothetical protein